MSFFHYVILRFLVIFTVCKPDSKNERDGLNEFLLVCVLFFFSLSFGNFAFYNCAWTHSSHWIASRISFVCFILLSLASLLLCFPCLPCLLSFFFCVCLYCVFWDYLAYSTTTVSRFSFKLSCLRLRFACWLFCFLLLLIKGVWKVSMRVNTAFAQGFFFAL